MAIALRSQSSTTYASRTNTVVTAPASISDGDILVCAIVGAAQTTAPTITGPTGWTAFGTATSVLDGGSFNAKYWLFWKRAASESGSYTFTHTTASTQAFLAAYSGCIASGTPLGATANNVGSNNTATGLSITTTAANSWLLYFEHCWGDSAQSAPTSPVMTTDLNGAIVFASHLLFASAGATGNVTQNNGNSTADPWATRMVELLAATGGGTSTGTLSATLGAATLAGTGNIPARGTASNTLGVATLAATGTVANQVFSGSFNQALGALNATLTGKVTTGGTAAGTLFPLTLVGTGNVATRVFTGTLSATLAPLTLAAAGTAVNRVASGALNTTLAALALAARGRTAVSVSPPRRVWLVGRLDTQVALSARLATTVALVGRLVTNIPLTQVSEVNYGRNVHDVRRRYKVVAGGRAERSRRAG